MLSNKIYPGKWRIGLPTKLSGTLWLFILLLLPGIKLIHLVCLRLFQLQKPTNEWSYSHIPTFSLEYAFFITDLGFILGDENGWETDSLSNAEPDLKPLLLLHCQLHILFALKRKGTNLTTL